MDKIPHTLRIHQTFALGSTYSFRLAVQHLDSKAKANLAESNRRFAWTITDYAVSGDYLTVTAVPGLNHQFDAHKKNPTLDGGGDGSLTFFVDNPDSTDPAPPQIYTSYTE